MRPTPDDRLRAGKTRLYLSLALMFCLSPALQAQQAAPTTTNSDEAWQQFNWLQSSDEQQRQAAAGTTFNTSAGQDIKDPASVLSSGSLWQEKYTLAYTQRVADSLSLSYETSELELCDGPNPFQPVIGDTGGDLYREQTAGFQFQPLDALTLCGNVHDSSSDLSNPSAPTVTTGTGLSAESHLPMSSTLTLNMNSDRTGTDLTAGSTAHDTTYDAQFLQPLGKVPLTAELKGHYEEITTTGSPPSRFPSLEQSLVWKPAQETTLQMGLRQQQYEESPGISDEFNQALFADWTQTLVSNVTWHSYAEMMNSKELSTISPSASTTSQANGSTPSASLRSTLPVSLDDETLTFTTGPAFKLQKDLSASIEYSSRWDKNPQPGDMGEEQRVSVSLKGTF